ncbi:hypothetical protein G6L37_34760 [Agrobacterium rubi]|nr:hypothetical protein [Agrobacterium rubi]NTF23730.1 hypothetical protein [Agrobacterium rubi]
MNGARLQFRWEADEKQAQEFGCREWICKYELSIPLDEHDVRRENENGKKVRDRHVVELGSTRRQSSHEPCMAENGDYHFDVPFRDGAHAAWDAPKLGNLPIICIAVDGTIIPDPHRAEDTAVGGAKPIRPAAEERP